MNSARFKVSFAGPMVSFQDCGRRGHLRFGVSPSGPMDRISHALGNAMLGNPLTATSIEVSLGGLILECLEGEVTLSLAGGNFNGSCGEFKTQSWSVRTICTGQKLVIRAGEWGSWIYLAFAGCLDASEWLGSKSTHSMTGFGGGMLTAGMEFNVTQAEARDSRVGSYACPNIVKTTSDIRVVVGPQDQHFTEDAIHTFVNEAFALTDAFDRMGVRLKGPHLQIKDALSIPSEPIVRGSIQVSGDGVSTVLLADHQTTGGYPKIATILSSDVDRFAQLRAGDTVRFRSIDAATAIIAKRAYEEQLHGAIAQMAAPQATLAERLNSLNLISGVFSPEAD